MPITFIRKPKVQVEMKVQKMDAFSEQVYTYLKKYLGNTDGRAVWMEGQKISNLKDRHLFYVDCCLKIEEEIHNNPIKIAGMKEFSKYRIQPVGVEEFCFSPDYLDKKKEIYPAVMEEIIEMNSGKYVEIVLTGGIGSAKTTCALYTTAYQLYLLSCMRSPHLTYGLDPSSEILIIFQSITAKLAKDVDYARFKSMIEGSKYFREKFPFDKEQTSRMVFPNRIEVRPVSGAETAAIGQNVIGGVIDELNYMSVVEKSKQSADAGTYDQAVALYNSISRRRQSRFQSEGTMPGILCLVSSKKYPGQFTDRKQEEARTNPAIYVYDKRVWEVKPEGTFKLPMFAVFVGDMTRKPRILEEGEEVKDDDRDLILLVPGDFRSAFVTDIINALREIGGISTLARHPYFLETDKVSSSFGKHASIFSSEQVDFVSQRLALRKNAFFKPELPRFAHVDLAITGDSAGVAVGCVIGFKSMKELGRGSDAGMMPIIHIDGILEVVPPRNSEILFYKIRETFIALRKMGLNVRWITYDSFESTDSQQLLRQQGFTTGYQSVDVVPCVPYDYLKSSIYDGRCKMPQHPHAQREILMLERDTKTTKIDHPPGGSKDCLSGATPIPLLDGTTPMLKDLVGKEVWVYGCRDNGRVVPALARNIRSKGVRKTVRVTLTTGQEIDCTEDHEFMLRDGSYKAAGSLVAGQSLMPLYRDVSIANSKSALNGYEKIWCNQLQSYVFTHHRVAEEIFGFVHGRAKKERGVIHHKDFRKRNNAPNNLDLMGWEEHRNLHNSLGCTNLSALHKKEDFRAFNKERASKLGKVTGPINLARYNRSEERILKLKESGLFATNGKAVMKKNWEDAGFRARHKLRVSGNSNPNARKDVTLALVLDEAKNCSSLEGLYRRLECTQKVVYRVLREAGLTSQRLRGDFINHNVSKVELLGEEEVFDMTVDSTNNFAVGQGVFVHNCADALAGVVYGLTMRREIWSMYGIPLMQMPEALLKAKTDKLEDKDARLKEAMRQVEELSDLERIRQRVPK